MIQVDPTLKLPTSAELPCSDDVPVDNEDQNLLPNYLLFLLYRIWADRFDWFFAVDMGLYHLSGGNPRVPVVPDAFLSVGVDRKKNGESRPSYVMWEEGGIAPILALEMVSHTPGGEYDRKVEIYRKLGVLYYVIYNPRFWLRDGHQPFEVYKLENGAYRLQVGEPLWMPEVGLGIGRRQLNLGNIDQEGLTWFDVLGNPYLDADELVQQELAQRVVAEREQRRAERERDLERSAREAVELDRDIAARDRDTERLAREAAERDRETLLAKLRELGIDPDAI
jgi:Uma2 family endonuclease